MTQSKSVNAQQVIRTLGNDIHTNNPRLRTNHELRFRDVFVTHANSTR